MSISNKKRKLRVGFFIDDTNVNYYVADLIKFVREDENFESPILITGYAKKIPKKSLWHKLTYLIRKNPFKAFDQVLRGVFIRLIKKRERKLILKKFPNYEIKNELLALGNFETVVLDGKWSKSGLILRLMNKIFFSA